MANKDQELINALGELNAATATFSTDLFSGELDQEDHITMTLLLLDAADQVLKRLAEGAAT
ncbi:MAG: hypothetical protein ACT4NY_28495 [Pseudonocardiales bacterium]